MLQKESIVTNSDNSGVKKLKVFNIYRAGTGYQGTVNFFVYGSIKKKSAFRNPKLLQRYLRRKARGCIIRSRHSSRSLDHQYIRSVDNATAIFSKYAWRYNIRVHGPLFLKTRRQRYFLLSRKIV